MNKFSALIWRFKIWRIDVKIKNLGRKHKRLIDRFNYIYREAETYCVSDISPFSMILIRDLNNVSEELRDSLVIMSSLEISKVKILKRLGQ
jgi:hypothetical protein